ncbi:hypothetical protein BDV38DRAFT_130460 [Aspergillus pseudotamarii]|uniref:Uncharacterized protein n=1 Tax=Aspergillus pseudotamarii TaxID=132259 RepID=A0A5N6SPB4_ASPPS|nr:uncharacterized protein BDV38DRAFT_130460 [Aspergillus pseudotamarii]KAE8135699.1 hypothetical protein BDV38DRAFT_130460 [Aspergillus pseudotamarii]
MGRSALITLTRDLTGGHLSFMIGSNRVLFASVFFYLRVMVPSQAKRIKNNNNNKKKINGLKEVGETFGSKNKTKQYIYTHFHCLSTRIRRSHQSMFK